MDMGLTSAHGHTHSSTSVRRTVSHPDPENDLVLNSDHLVCEVFVFVYVGIYVAFEGGGSRECRVTGRG
jgi:hypothetical protein